MQSQVFPEEVMPEETAAVVEETERLRAIGRANLTQAWRSSTCICCDEGISAGDPVYPIEKRRLKLEAATTGGRSGLAWIHPPCASTLGGGEPPPLPICKHFARAGTCLYEKTCFFSHPAEVGLQALARHSDRRANPTAKVANRGDGRRNYVKNGSRASILRRWLLDTFGIDSLRQGSGVLDVAGGKGELAWELLNLNKIPATVVEPRGLELQAFRRKLSYGMYWRNPIFHRYLHCTLDPQVETESPLHLQLLLTPDILENLAFDDNFTETPSGTHIPRRDVAAEWELAFRDSWTKARALRWTRKGLQEHEDDEGAAQQHHPADLFVQAEARTPPGAAAEGDGTQENSEQCEQGVLHDAAGRLPAPAETNRHVDRGTQPAQDEGRATAPEAGDAELEIDGDDTQPCESDGQVIDSANQAAALIRYTQIKQPNLRLD
eukprot:TRINITY_DN7840_c0_g1_i4.p1 TRINITY_DN7840_c0_g1~~TRINITY_DN7840_c0_g1_i4.p1  ORF type:complete len:436 (+),score=53.06 TRINITY_DN7840_c0_g1_i4:180-1487(+)